MSTFSERIKKKKQVMVASLMSRETKAALDEIAKITRRSKSGCIELALRKWISEERQRVKGSTSEILTPAISA